MTVRCASIEIYGLNKSENRDNWKSLAVSVQRIKNRLWQIWLCHHSNNDSASKLRVHFEAFREWKETKQGEKPQWPCKAVEEPLTKSADSRSFYRIISSEFPEVNVRTRGLVTNAWQSLLSKRKSASGSLPGWVSILFANESLPSFTHPQPIPFDKENARLIKADGKYYVELRIERLADSGKSVVERCELMLNRRKTASVRAIVEKIISGEYAWKGSNLCYRKGKWFAQIGYEMPSISAAGLDPKKVLYVRPGRLSPFRVRINDGSFRFGGNGMHVTRMRRVIHQQRVERKEHNRWGGSNRRGHGARQAKSIWTVLSSRWKDFTKRYNNEVSTRLIHLAKRNGCGRIVYLQPKDSKRDSRFLSRGAQPYDQMTWDYFQFGSMLSNKCQHEGIEYGVEKRVVKKSDTRGVRALRKSFQTV